MVISKSTVFLGLATGACIAAGLAAPDVMCAIQQRAENYVEYFETPNVEFKLESDNSVLLAMELAGHSDINYPITKAGTMTEEEVLAAVTEVNRHFAKAGFGREISADCDFSIYPYMAYREDVESAAILWRCDGAAPDGGVAVEAVVDDGSGKVVSYLVRSEKDASSDRRGESGVASGGGTTALPEAPDAQTMEGWATAWAEYLGLECSIGEPAWEFGEGEEALGINPDDFSENDIAAMMQGGVVDGAEGAGLPDETPRREARCSVAVSVSNSEVQFMLEWFAYTASASITIWSMMPY